MNFQTNQKPLIPIHLGIIMDGNGRWAIKRGLPRTAGHYAGVRTAHRIVEACAYIGIRFLTLYVFSTENWCRPPEEIDFLMSLAKEYAIRELPELQRNGVRLQLMGERKDIPQSVLKALDRAISETQGNSRLVLNIALNYGGRTEIINAVKTILSAQEQDFLDVSHLNETTFEKYLYCPDCPDVDLIIRTGGEWRLSNFMLWRAAEAVFWSTPILWPDFQQHHLEEALEVYVQQISEGKGNT
jgi:undecaprenyl diphosphate synthase